MKKKILAFVVGAAIAAGIFVAGQPTQLFADGSPSIPTGTVADGSPSIPTSTTPTVGIQS